MSASQGITPAAHTAPPWQTVLDFWFLPLGAPGHLEVRKEWFRKDPAFDEEIRTRFEPLVRSAVADGLREWEASPQGALARLILLDQFTRNIWRNTPAAFSGDVPALAAAQRTVDAGHDQALDPVARTFVYLPFEHAEDLSQQARSIALFTALVAVHPASAEQLDYAQRHEQVIRQFGRFPHRNRILGRSDTPAEAVYLAQPGSGF
jgi:uncharacterized protein (DUF924 family)